MKDEYIFLGCFLVAVGIIFYLLMFVNPQAKQCLTDPIGFGEEKMGEGIVCECKKTGGWTIDTDEIIWAGNVGLNLTGQNLILKGGMKNESN